MLKSSDFNLVCSFSRVTSAGWGIWYYSEPHEGCVHTTAILVFQNNEMVAMLISQTDPLGDELLFFYVNTFFFACFDILFLTSKFTWLLAMWVKMPSWGLLITPRHLATISFTIFCSLLLAFETKFFAPSTMKIVAIFSIQTISVSNR